MVETDYYMIMVNSINISDEQRSAIIGFHDFTGNDYVSSFFLKGQKRCLEVAIKSLLFLVAFAALGNDLKFEKQVISTLE